MAFFKIFMSLQAFRTRIHILTALADFPIQVLYYLLKMFGFFFTVLWCKGIRISKHRFLCVFKKSFLKLTSDDSKIKSLCDMWSDKSLQLLLNPLLHRSSCMSRCKQLILVYSLWVFSFSFWHFYFVYSVRVRFFLIPSCVKNRTFVWMKHKITRFPDSFKFYFNNRIF